jgi:hypothetical protein
VSLWRPDDGREPRVNVQVVASLVQPMGQIGKRRPRQQRRDLPTRGRDVMPTSTSSPIGSTRVAPMRRLGDDAPDAALRPVVGSQRLVVTISDSAHGKNW